MSKISIYKAIVESQKLPDQLTTYSNTKINRIYQNDFMDIGRFELKADTILYIDPLKAMRSYFILEGQCKELKSKKLLTAGDLFVYDKEEEIITLHMLTDVVILVHSQRAEAIESFKESNGLIVRLLSDIQAKDHYTKAHSDRVFMLVKRMALKLGYHSNALFNINKAARFHDVGKIFIPDEVLNKPKALDPDEYDIIKKHVTLCESMILEKYNEEIYEIIVQHHERLDGSGYPRGLKADEISEPAKILAICDSYDAMTTDRVYKEGKSKAVAIQELIMLSGQYYDPELVAVFIEMIKNDDEIEKESNFKDMDLKI